MREMRDAARYCLCCKDAAALPRPDMRPTFTFHTAESPLPAVFRAHICAYFSKMPLRRDYAAADAIV